MELNLRKARKLEAAVGAHVTKMEITAAVKVRVLATQSERTELVEAGNEDLFCQLDTRSGLIKARFQIRQLISDANQAVGVTALMNRKETLEALLAVSPTGLDTVNFDEMQDNATAQKSRLERGTETYGTSVTMAVPVAYPEDLELFKEHAKALKKELESVEDQLAQKNLGAKVTLNEDLVGLLTRAGLL